MSHDEYQLLAIDETYEIPRALILVITNGKPACLYQIDCYGYELPPFDKEQASKEETKQ